MLSKELWWFLCFCSIELSCSSKVSQPKLIQLVNQRTQDEGANFQILCSVEKGSEPFFFEWSKNGQTLRPSPDVKYRIENSKISSTLTIENVARSDAGNYSCLVKNGVGSDSQNIVLKIKGNC